MNIVLIGNHFIFPRFLFSLTKAIRWWRHPPGSDIILLENNINAHVSEY